MTKLKGIIEVILDLLLLEVLFECLDGFFVLEALGGVFLEEFSLIILILLGRKQSHIPSKTQQIFLRRQTSCSLLKREQPILCKVLLVIKVTIGLVSPSVFYLNGFVRSQSRVFMQQTSALF